MMNLRARAYADQGYSARRISEMCGITMKDARRIKNGCVAAAPFEPTVDLPPVKALSQYRMLDIMAAVSQVFHVKVRDIQGEGRSTSVANARQAAMWIAWESGWTTSEIGKSLGLHHTTILHGARSAERRMRMFATYRERVHAAVCTLERNEAEALSSLTEAEPEPTRFETAKKPSAKPAVSLKRAAASPKPPKPVKQPLERVKPKQAKPAKQAPRIEPPPPSSVVVRDFAIGQERREREHLERLKQPPPMCSEAWWKWNDIRFRNGMRAAGYHEDISAMRGAA